MWANRQIPNTSSQKELLAEAQRAAENKDCSAMLSSLSSSMLLEAYLGYFIKKYPDVDRGDIHDCLGMATDELWSRVAKGEKIAKIKSYLWKITDRKICDFIRSRKWVPLDKVDVIATNHELIDSVNYQQHREESREQLLGLFEGLIPRLGMANVEDVMRYILGAIREGIQEVTSDEIAAALNLTPANVRQSMKRGFDRLTLIVKEENLVDESFRFPFVDEMGSYMSYSDTDDEWS
jgi:RNA polymerase sigma factor (sigma-70 family)